MPTTPEYLWPIPAPSDPNDPPADFTAGLLAVEATLKNNPGVPKVRYAATGGIVLGTVDRTKPLNIWQRFVTVTTDATGVFTLALPAGATCVTCAQPQISSNGAWFAIYDAGNSSLTSLRFRAFTAAGGAASAVINVIITVFYQGTLD